VTLTALRDHELLENGTQGPVCDDIVFVKLQFENHNQLGSSV
jgi:hypothetical protein